MLAFVLDELKGLHLKEVPDPAAPPGGILVQVESCAVCGTDLKVRAQADVKLEGKALKTMHYPRIPGHEIAGTVLQAEYDATGLRPGDRIQVAPSIPCGKCFYCTRGMEEMCDDLLVVGYDIDGGFAEIMAVPPRAVRMKCVNIVPEWVSLDEASLVEPLSCVVNAHYLSGTRPGDVVVVIGGGPLGCFHVEIARLRGASKIILSERLPDRLEQSRLAQADLYVNPVEEDLVDRVLHETGGRGADVVMVACGVGAAQIQGVEMVAKRGSVNFFGGLPRDKQEVGLNTNLIHYREARVIGTHGSSPAHNREALDLIKSRSINPSKYITARFPLADADAAFDMAAAGKALKVVVGPVPIIQGNSHDGAERKG